MAPSAVIRGFFARWGLLIGVARDWNRWAGAVQGTSSRRRAGPRWGLTDGLRSLRVDPDPPGVRAMAGRVEGKVALITGAAGGIGLATAELFAREGAAVVMADTQADLLQRECEQLVARGL